MKEFDLSIEIGFDKEDRIKANIKEKTIQDLKADGKKLYINGVGVDEVNSADGVDISLEWAYFDESKDIKYIYFTFVPYNNVGDQQSCRIRDYSRFRGLATGPISAENNFHTYSWETAWYNSTITCIKIIKVEIQYMDGSSYTYIKELSKIMNPDFKNVCE